MTKSKLKETLGNNLSWPSVLSESIKEGVSCLLYNDLLKLENSVPKDILSSLKQIYYKNALKIIPGLKEDLKTLLPADK